ncbi:hypothetical protein LVO79_02865 [Roseivivax marinus]|jgi:hypothetical protein|uniref:hypothetical protein n=1 Tax=Roseivivax marinus TaxID=1379903 RepID=UPI0004B662BD|nr:hypothetical protein [Roseivivax marinus]UMA65421.1 hypothetical protein LVO79_02865 [Roseivivax marinus]SEL79565.1 hypothetical protein SAMN05444413_11685 [Roseivivax marinus]
MTPNAPATPQPEEARPDVSAHTRTSEDIRGRQTTRYDQSEHRRYAWLYEDLLA